MMDDAVRFEADAEGSPFACKGGGRAPSPAALLLQELVDNGQAEVDGDAVLVPHAEAAALAPIDQQLLALPAPYPFDLRVAADGTLEQDTFAFEVEYRAFDKGQQYVAVRSGCIVRVTDVEGREAEYVLSPAALTLCEVVEEFNRSPAGALADRLKRLADVQELALAADARLDGYLEGQDVVAPDVLTFDVRAEGDAVTVVPALPDAPEFAAKFERFPNVRPVYSVAHPDGRRQRVAFTERQQGELKKAKRLKGVTGAEREALLEHPEALFDPDLVDLDAFSERVVELGAYRPRFYPFVSAYQSEWTPGFIVETSPEDRKRVSFDTEEEVEAFGAVVERALSAGADRVEWEDTEVPVRAAERILATARRQFEDRSKPATPSDKEERQEELVLIIKENIEGVDFGEVGPGAPEVEHVYSPPPFLRAGMQPRDHQQEGIAWLQGLCADHSGALLADDMGLGKTFTVLSFIKWHAAQVAPSASPYLVVAPVSLLENWENEVNRFFVPSPPEITRLYGQDLKAMAGEAGGDPRALARLLQRPHICLTTYETLRRQQLAFAAVDWAVVVLDEAQRIKTPGTLVTNAAKALKADFKVAMTGTPVENSLVDLWCIVDFLVPGLLGGAKEFARDYQRPLDEPDADVAALGERLRVRLGDYIKRRLKSGVLGDLPEKEFHVLPREMPPEQRERYLVEVAAVQEARSDEAVPGHEVLRALHAMRAISDHPYLPDRRLDDVDTDTLVRTSAKLQVTVEVLKDIQAKGEKVLLFAERRETQRMLVNVLRDRFGVDARIINGDTPSTARSGRSSKLSRQQTIDAFEAAPGFGALVLSPVAAGVGLNVTAANHVIHYARHWNPAKEDQATDRAYRIGQERDVHVYYPMATLPQFNGVDVKSFDVVLDELLEHKRALANASLFPTERAEVRPDELFGSVFGSARRPRWKAQSAPLTMEDVDSLAPAAFEAFVAALWAARGYRVLLTPARKDQGADVAAFSDDGNVLLQVKQSSGSVGVSAVQEVVAARAFYEEYFGETLDLGVVTNADLTASALSLARDNGVVTMGRDVLTALLEEHPVTIADVAAAERRRITSLK